MSKYLLVLFSLILFSISAYAGTSFVLPAVTLDTTPPPPIEEVFNIVEIMPSFSGCEGIEDSDERRECSDKNIISFINKNIKYPEKAREEGIEGNAVVRFTIEKDGKITTNEKSILRDPGGGIGKEALRIVNIMPDWIPGKNKDEPVRVQFTLPIKFVLTVEEVIPEFQEVIVKWNGVELKGLRKSVDRSLYTKAECSLEQVNKILSEKNKGLPLMFNYGKEKGGFTQYYVVVGKKKRKELITSISSHKSVKKRLLKNVIPGSIIYFYNWEYKKGILEIEVK
ncbi:MAG: TonB family protein [Maribacter sp.]|jgi:TonB family protein